MDDNGGAFHSHLFVGQNDEEVVDQMRARLGDAAAEEYLRTQELRRNPRPLDEDQRAALDAVLAPILADLRAAGAIVPAVRYEAWEDRGPNYVSAFIGPPGESTGTGVWVDRSESAAAELARLADQVQEWEVEELAAQGRPATWPQCPEHPNSHPLEPVAGADDAAVWRCPRSQRVAGLIGQLGG